MRLHLRLCGSACHQKMAPMLWSASCPKLRLPHIGRPLSFCAWSSIHRRLCPWCQRRRGERGERGREKRDVRHNGHGAPCVLRRRNLLALRIRLRLHRSPHAKPDLAARRIIASSRLPARAPRRPWSRRDHDAYLWFETTRCGPATSTFAAMRKCCRTTLRCARWAPTRGSCSTRSRPAARLL